MKARKVKKLDPAAPLADNLERIVEVRLAELCSFMPKASDPDEVVTLHDMRIAAKRLRYILEVGAPCFGPYAATAIGRLKELQDVLGEIHDCDVQVPRTRRVLARCVVEDAWQLAAGVDDELAPAALLEAPHRHAYAGLVGMTAFLEARRDVLFRRFTALWTDFERDGFAARLRFAVTERPA